MYSDSNYSLAKAFMVRNFSDYLSRGEVNYTKLAEAAADNLCIYDDRAYSVPEWIFDLAVDVAEEIGA